MSTSCDVSSSTPVHTIPLRAREAIELEIQRRIEAERARLQASIASQQLTCARSIEPDRACPSGDAHHSARLNPVVLSRDMKHAARLGDVDHMVSQHASGLGGNAALEEQDSLCAREVLFFNLPRQILARAGLSTDVFVDHQEIELLAERIHGG